MPRLSDRTGNLHGSAVRAMLSAAQQPGVISFAGGLPAPDSFEDLDLPAPPADCLQYGPTEGEPTLRAAIARELSAIGLTCPPERILVLSGSQQGIDLVGKLTIDEGAPVAVEEPSYLAALQVFRFFGARFETLHAGDAAAGWDLAPPVLAYVTPTFQNPTGRCWTAAERADLAAACDRHDVILFEDDPYRDLAYDPCDWTPICAGVRSASWVYQGSFSKTVAPGLRLGFLAASEDLIAPLTHLKQAADLHSSRLSQCLVERYLADPARAQRTSALVGRWAVSRSPSAMPRFRRSGMISGATFLASAMTGAASSQIRRTSA